VRYIPAAGCAGVGDGEGEGEELNQPIVSVCGQ